MSYLSGNIQRDVQKLQLQLDGLERDIKTKETNLEELRRAVDETKRRIMSLNTEKKTVRI